MASCSKTQPNARTMRRRKLNWIGEADSRPRWGRVEMRGQEDPQDIASWAPRKLAEMASARRPL